MHSEWNYTLDDFKLDIGILADTVVKHFGRPDTFVVPTRSGLMVGSALAYKMGYTPKFLVVDPDHLLTYKKLPPPREGRDFNTVLFVDNFYDSGRTFHMHSDNYHNTFPERADCPTMLVAAFLIGNIAATIPPNALVARTLDRKLDSSFVNFWWEQL